MVQITSEASTAPMMDKNLKSAKPNTVARSGYHTVVLIFVLIIVAKFVFEHGNIEVWPHLKSLTNAGNMKSAETSSERRWNRMEVNLNKKIP